MSQGVFQPVGAIYGGRARAPGRCYKGSTRTQKLDAKKNDFTQRKSVLTVDRLCFLMAWATCLASRFHLVALAHMPEDVLSLFVSGTNGHGRTHHDCYLHTGDMLIG
jgi:hypothetical protein